MGDNTLRGHVFEVGPEGDSKPWCAWDWDMPTVNMQFLESIDADYFGYVVGLHLPQLDGEDSHRAAIAIRTAYHHSLETLFTLFGAALQAPRSVAAWIPKCATGTLRSLVREISLGGRVPNQLGLDDVSWEALARAMFGHIKCEPDDREKIAKNFSILWSRLAGEFLREESAAEYNSIKHGFRFRPGGFTLASGVEPSYGVAPASNQMRLLGGSMFGSSYFVVELPRGAPPGAEKSPHFRLRRKAVNWDPKANAKAVQLVAVSIANLIASLKRMNGATGDLSVLVPPDDQFEAPWSTSVGVHSMSMDRAVQESDIQRLSRNELEDVLRKKTTAQPNLPGTGTKPPA